MDAEVLKIIEIVGGLMVTFLIGMGGYKVQQRLASSTVKKQDREGTKEIVEAATALIKPLKDELMELQEKFEKQQREFEIKFACQQEEISQLQQGVRILIAQLEKLHIIPEWTPQDYKPIENVDKKREQVRNITTDKTPR